MPVVGQVAGVWAEKKNQGQIKQPDCSKGSVFVCLFKLSEICHWFRPETVLATKRTKYNIFFYILFIFRFLWLLCLSVCLSVRSERSPLLLTLISAGFQTLFCVKL